MLRLLPDRVYVGLFGKDAWVARGAKQEPFPAPSSLPLDGTPAEMLDVLLQMAPSRHRPGTLSIMLPSAMACCVSLPWSPHLHSIEEMHGYALAHLEQAGMGAGESHAVHAEFRHYGAQGFAYAVSKELLALLHTVSARHSLELTTVHPIGAIAHLAAQPARGPGDELTLVVEEAAVSALLMSGTGLQNYDAEPAIGGQRAAMRRLMTRFAASGVAFKNITLCAPGDDDELARLAMSLEGQTLVRSVKPHEWRKYL